MPHHADVHETRIVVDRVDHAVFSDANSLQVGRPLQLGASMRSRIFRQRLDARDDPSRHASLEAFQFAPSGAREDNSVLSHAAGDLGRAS